jgi:hypothetical protein
MGGGPGQMVTVVSQRSSNGTCTNISGFRWYKMQRVYRAKCARTATSSAPYYYRRDGGAFRKGDILVYRYDQGLIGQLIQKVTEEVWPGQPVWTHSAICSRVNSMGVCIEVVEQHAGEDADYKKDSWRSVDSGKMAQLPPGAHRAYAETHRKGGFMISPNTALRADISSWIDDPAIVPSRASCAASGACAGSAKPARYPNDADGSCSGGTGEYGCGYLKGENTLCSNGYGKLETNACFVSQELCSYCFPKWNFGSGYSYAIGNYGQEYVHATWNDPSSPLADNRQCTSFVATRLNAAEGKKQLSLSDAQVFRLAQAVDSLVYTKCRQTTDFNILTSLLSMLQPGHFLNPVDENEVCTNVKHAIVNLFLYHDQEWPHYFFPGASKGRGGHDWPTHRPFVVGNVTPPHVLYRAQLGDYGATRFENPGTLVEFEWTPRNTTTCMQWTRRTERNDEGETSGTSHAPFCGDRICESKHGEDADSCPIDCSTYVYVSQADRGVLLTAPPRKDDGTDVYTTVAGLNCDPGYFNTIQNTGYPGGSQSPAAPLLCKSGYNPGDTVTVTGSCPTNCPVLSVAANGTSQAGTSVSVAVSSPTVVSVQCGRSSSAPGFCVNSCQCGGANPGYCNASGQCVYPSQNPCNAQAKGTSRALPCQPAGGGRH